MSDLGAGRLLHTSHLCAHSVERGSYSAQGIASHPHSPVVLRSCRLFCYFFWTSRFVVSLPKPSSRSIPARGVAVVCIPTDMYFTRISLLSFSSNNGCLSACSSPECVYVHWLRVKRLPCRNVPLHCHSYPHTSARKSVYVCVCIQLIQVVLMMW